MNFIAGEKCFAKVRGFPHWPARINFLPPTVKIPKGKYPIFFYGTYEVCFLPASAIYPYETNKHKFGNPRNTSCFNKGIDELENNPTILQYGSDPEALKFLNQFYKFPIPKKSKQVLLNLDTTKNLKQESLDSDLLSETSSNIDKTTIITPESQLEIQQPQIKDSADDTILESLEEIIHNDENTLPLNVTEEMDLKHEAEVILDILSSTKEEGVSHTDEYTSDFKNLLSEIRKYSWSKTKATHIQRTLIKRSLDSRIKLFYPWYQSPRK